MSQSVAIKNNKLLKSRIQTQTAAYNTHKSLRGPPTIQQHAIYQSQLAH